MSSRVVVALLRRPLLWAEAVRFVAAIYCKEWRNPLLYVHSSARDYLRWRIGTAYGDPDAEVVPADVVALLRWRRRQRLS